ncbi:hypothetical protein BKA70DRAFT_1424104 [Coprinopsis sp. MPI-PUGE-AT-0042]|nr:hypothetical protein BKA70DRAFT_1424104 [Coprinopsis sp. MPI-PUGE-AT-0042]
MTTPASHTQNLRPGYSIELTSTDATSPRLFTTGVRQYQGYSSTQPGAAPAVPIAVNMLGPYANEAQAAVFFGFAQHNAYLEPNQPTTDPNAAHPRKIRALQRVTTVKETTMILMTLPPPRPCPDPKPNVSTNYQTAFASPAIPTMASHGPMIKEAARLKLLDAILQGRTSTVDDIDAVVTDALREPLIFNSLLQHCYPGVVLDPEVMVNNHNWMTSMETPVFHDHVAARISDDIIKTISSQLWHEILRPILELTLEYIAQYIIMDAKLFPDLHRYSSSRSMQRLRSELLLYALTGGYTHFFFTKHPTLLHSFDLPTHSETHLSAVRADKILEHLCRNRPMGSTETAGLLHFRHGAVILILQKMADELIFLYGLELVILRVAELRTSIATGPIGPSNPGVIKTLQLIKIPIALLSATLFACYHRGTIAIPHKEILDFAVFNQVFTLKVDSTGTFLRQSGQYIHLVEMKYLTTTLLDALSPQAENLSPLAINDFALTFVPQNLSYPIQSYPPLCQPVAERNQQSMERRNNHLESYAAGHPLTFTFHTWALQPQSEMDLSRQ